MKNHQKRISARDWETSTPGLAGLKKPMWYHSVQSTLMLTFSIDFLPSPLRQTPHTYELYRRFESV